MGFVFTCTIHSILLVTSHKWFLNGKYATNTMRKFTILMPFRDTPREREFAKKSIPSAINLDPDELIIAVDAPADKSFIAYIEDLCKASSFDNYKIQEIPRSDDWSMHLANIVWQCYKESRNDKILSTDVDAVLRSKVLIGYDMVGKDDTAAVSFTRKPEIKNLSHLIRHVFARIRIATSDYAFGPNYWIYRPYYFQNVNVEAFKKITNGLDMFLPEIIQRNNTHKIITLRDIGSDSMDIGNDAQPWRQFGAGVWLYANRKELRDPQEKARLKNYSRTIGVNDPSIMGRIRRFIHKWPIITITINLLLYHYTWHARGWWWASKNKNHKAVQAAYKKSIYDWNLEESKHVRDIYDWKKHGRVGTGFD